MSSSTQYKAAHAERCTDIDWTRNRPRQASLANAEQRASVSRYHLALGVRLSVSAGEFDALRFAVAHLMVMK
ncbi:hypothetical protein J3R83DRAFT_13533 [Lanmaoa asiatica]|nr:hypothetical protein J3R83DRAFT_13533 [Lanmaoa asiatica]